MNWINSELVLASIGAMLLPTTLIFSVSVLVLSNRPLRTGFWFYLGALLAMVAIGIAAAFVLGDHAASPDKTPKTWVAVLDLVLGAFLVVWAWRARKRSIDPAKIDGMMDKMSGVAASRWIAVLAAGATLANAGAFIPVALKDISELDPSRTQYIVDWLFFSVVSLLPLGIALLLLVVARDWTTAMLARTRDWLVAHAWSVALGLVLLVALSLLRNGIAGLTS